jgi:hypothetical protein
VWGGGEGGMHMYIFYNDEKLDIIVEKEEKEGGELKKTNML